MRKIVGLLLVGISLLATDYDKEFAYLFDTTPHTIIETDEDVDRLGVSTWITNEKVYTDSIVAKVVYSNSEALKPIKAQGGKVETYITQEYKVRNKVASNANRYWQFLLDSIWEDESISMFHYWEFDKLRWKMTINNMKNHSGADKSNYFGARVYKYADPVHDKYYMMARLPVKETNAIFIDDLRKSTTPTMFKKYMSTKIGLWLQQQMAMDGQEVVFEEEKPKQKVVEHIDLRPYLNAVDRPAI